MIRGLFALCCTGLLLLAGCDKTPEPQKTSETQLIPAANAEIAKRNPEMNVERMKFSWKALKDGAFVYGSDPSGALTGKFDPQRWNENYQILRSLGVITKDIDSARCYSLEFTKDL
jgi:hypothetical protein